MTARRPLVNVAGQTQEIPSGDILSYDIGTDLRNLLDIGEETIPRSWCNSNTLASTSQTLRLTYFRARKTETTTQVRVSTGTTAAGATPTLCRIGLYSIDSTTLNGTLVASTSNDTTLFASANTAYTKSWSSPYNKVTGQFYALGLLVVTVAASPSWPGLAVAIGLSSELLLSPRMTGSIAAQSDLPSTFTSVTPTSSVNQYYSAILP